MIKEFQEWVREYKELLIISGFCLFFICAGIGLLLMPVGFRGGVMPKLNEILVEIQELENRVNQRINLLSDIEEQNVRFMRYVY